MKNNRERQVVPLKAWKEARILEQSLLAGDPCDLCPLECFAEMQDEDPLSHMGIVYAVPAPEPLGCGDLSGWEDETVDAIETEAFSEVLSMEDRDIERYEFLDLATQDLHIIYHIPLRPFGLAPVKGKPEV